MMKYFTQDSIDRPGPGRQTSSDEREDSCFPRHATCTEDNNRLGALLFIVFLIFELEAFKKRSRDI